MVFGPEGNDSLAFLALELDGGDGDDTLRGGDGDDLLSGGAGDDILAGRAGDDELDGGDGDDTLRGGDGDDLLAGGAGDDILAGHAGDDELDGGDGDDTLRGGDGDDLLSGGAGDDFLAGHAGDDELEGGDGNDTLRGEGNDVLSGGAGDDQITVIGGEGLTTVDGGAGSDTITIRNGAEVSSPLILDENDHLVLEAGGRLVTGNNAVTWTGAGDVVVDNAGLIEASRILNTGSGVDGSLVFNNLADGVVQGAINPSGAGAAGSTIAVNNAGLIEAGGRVIDFRSFDANGASAVINNLAGGTIRQYGSNTDIIRPGNNGTVNNWGTITTDPTFVGGGDLIDFQSDRGGVVNNYATGMMEGSRHAVTGDHAVTVLNEGTMIGRNGSAVNIDNDGSEADKVFITNHGTMEGRSAELSDSDGDAVDVDGLVQVLNYGRIAGMGAEGYHDGEPNVSEAIAIGGGVILNYGADAVIHGYGRAIQVDNSSNENALGTTFINNDGLIQGDGHGPEGVDPEDAAGFDLRGNEAINLVGDYADEVLNQSTGRIIGGVSMGGGNDRLSNSGLIAATGGSAIDMGAGDDVVNLYIGASVTGAILLGAGNDRLTANSYLNFDIELHAGDGNDDITTSFGNDVIHGGAGNDHIFAERGNDTIFAGDGDDTILADLGDDVIDGGNGFDTLFLAQATGPVSIDFAAGRVSAAGIGTDTFSNIENILLGAGNDIATGANGDDVFDGGAGNDTIDGGSGNDMLSGGVGDDVVKAGSGDDVIDGGEGADEIDGGSGDDMIVAGTGDDAVKGGSGDDRIEGGAGDDTIDGGSGQDAFVFAAGFGHDTIFDFKTSGSNADVLEFDTAIFADFGAAMAAADQVGRNVVFTVDADNTLTLQGVQMASLQADDFLFV
jgi:Ca2+-binding RTX toxin-like protein